MTLKRIAILGVVTAASLLIVGTESAQAQRYGYGYGYGNGFRSVPRSSFNFSIGVTKSNGFYGTGFGYRSYPKSPYFRGPGFGALPRSGFRYGYGRGGGYRYGRRGYCYP